ncbi:hypothetical protein V5799_008341 [Amblyomma americanum]|uniref:Secreted protein n=1 Tax=Amblyomma americanum TaxID=6943 RepID=A0AAQ4FDJ2_AMBAM
MMQSSLSTLCAPLFATLFVLHALCLNILLADEHNDAVTAVTTGTATASGSSEVADAPCTTHSVDIGFNIIPFLILFQA